MNVIGPPFSWFAAKYGKFWNRFAFSVDKQSGNRILSRKKSGLLIGLTFLAIMALTPTGIGDTIRFVTIEPLSDGILMAATLKTETFYLYSSEEVHPEQNIHSVRGCRTEGECSEKDASYFRVKPRLAHDLWKLIQYGNPIYVPDHVVAPIAPGVNKCIVTYYGYRITASWISRILRSLQVYPTMLEASCSHIAT